MSDFDDELLELAEKGPQKKAHKKKVKSKKRRTADISDYEGPESEEDDEGELYPLDGKYTDEGDRQRLLEMSEIEREEILSSRAEERQKILDRQAVRRMVNHQRKDDDSGPRSAKRQRTAVGATKEKTKKLDELKAKRQAKGDKKRSGASPRPHDSDMDQSSEEEEEGELHNGFNSPPPEASSELTLEGLNRVRVTRDFIVKNFAASWFEEYITNSWLRYNVGQHEITKENTYRLCQVLRVNPDRVRPYKIDGESIDFHVELQHGQAAKMFPLDKVSNSLFPVTEFIRLKTSCETEGVKLPTAKEVEQKARRMDFLRSQHVSDAEMSARLKRKAQIAEANGIKTASWITLQRGRLAQERTLASRRKDDADVARLDIEIEEFNMRYGEEAPPRRSENSTLAALSARNRKANAEAVRRAEIAASRERKMNMRNGVVDPSARLKTVPRTKIQTLSASASRSGTPSSLPPVTVDTEAAAPAVISTGLSRSFEASIVNSVEVDLGDF